MNQGVLDLQNVSLQIGGAKIIVDLSLSVEKGQMLGVIGPNGAGKTTMFNLISGIMSPTAGSIFLEGKNITSASIEDRARLGLGRTFQTSSLFPGLSAFENVRLAAQVRVGGEISMFHFPRPDDEAAKITNAALDEVGLAHHAQTQAGVLSHGDKRKLEIAMLLATEPKVILLDEPMAGVSSGDVPGLIEVIRRVHQSGRTVLMVEHHIEIVLGLVEKVAVLHHGELLAFDEPSAVMANKTVQSAYLGGSL
jgi:branched-chain amino acid transport system ATP-binding protein